MSWFVRLLIVFCMRAGALAIATTALPVQAEPAQTQVRFEQKQVEDATDQLREPQAFPSGAVTAGLLGGAVVGVVGLFMAATKNSPHLALQVAR